MSKIEDIIRSFTPEQEKVYNAMLGDMEKAHRDWAGCRSMYLDAMKVINDKDTGPEVRLLLRNVSDYWNRRKLAMERLLERTDNSEILKQWRADAKN